MVRKNVDVLGALGRKNAENRKNEAKEATDIMTGGSTKEESLPLMAGLAVETKLDIQSIPISDIVVRDVNEFDDVDITSLAESIKICGLINPISVICSYKNGKKTYTISAGHRRFKAFCYLHELEPENVDYLKIDCAVYEVAEKDAKNKIPGICYITPEQEEQIYRDSNLESRQLSYTDVAKQIRYILRKFDDSEYYERVKERASQRGLVTNKNADKAKLIINVLSTMNYDGWAKETIRQFIKVQESGREDLIDKIEKENLPVYKAYKEVIGESNKSRKRKTKKIVALRKTVNEFAKEAKEKQYSQAEINELNSFIKQLQEIVNNN